MNGVRRMIARGTLVALAGGAFALGFFSPQPPAATAASAATTAARSGDITARTTARQEECGSCLAYDYQAWDPYNGRPICNGSSPICYNSFSACLHANGTPDDNPGYLQRYCYFY